METESGLVVTRGWGGGRGGGATAHGDRVSFWGDENVLEPDRGGGYNPVTVLSAPELSALVNLVNFVVCTLYHNRRKKVTQLDTKFITKFHKGKGLFSPSPSKAGHANVTLWGVPQKFGGKVSWIKCGKRTKPHSGI